jgi:hypothetical protein
MIERKPLSGPILSAFLPAVLAAWFIYLAFDFLTHAVILAGWWRATENYWLPPKELFRLIPFGYASFAIYCTVLTWLLRRLYGEHLNLATGLRFGAIAGVVSGMGSVLGNYSAFPMPASALLVWPASITLYSTAAGGAATWVLVGKRPWIRAGLIFALAILFLVLGVVLQNLFFPTPTDHLISRGSDTIDCRPPASKTNSLGNP